MGLDIPDHPPKCPAPGMAVIRMTNFMFVIDQANIPILKLNVPGVPDMLCVITDQSHVIGIRNDHREILLVDCLQFFRGNHDHHPAPCSATI